MGRAVNYENDCVACKETYDDWEEGDGITPKNQHGDQYKICDKCLKCDDGVKEELEWKKERCPKCERFI